MPRDLEQRAELRLTVPKAAAYYHTFYFKNDGTAVDLEPGSTAIATITFYIKTNPGDADGDALLAKTVNISDTDHSFANGLIYLKLTSTDTNLTAGTYFWQFKITWTGTSNTPKREPSPMGELVITE